MAADTTLNYWWHLSANVDGDPPRSAGSLVNAWSEKRFENSEILVERIVTIGPDEVTYIHNDLNDPSLTLIQFGIIGSGTLLCTYFYALPTNAAVDLSTTAGDLIAVPQPSLSCVAPRTIDDYTLPGHQTLTTMFSDDPTDLWDAPARELWYLYRIALKNEGTADVKVAFTRIRQEAT